MTIESYMQVIAGRDRDENQDAARDRLEIARMQQLVHDSDRERQRALA